MPTTATKAQNAEVTKVVVESRIREVIDNVAPGTKLSGDAIDVLNTKVTGLITDAVLRCRENGRVTVKPQDF